MNDSVARAISFLFHPLLYPTYILLWLLNTGDAYSFLLPLHYKLLLLSLVFAMTCLIPVIIVMLLLKLNMIVSVFMVAREERIFPLIATGIFFYMTYYFFRDFYLPRQFPVFMLATTLMILVTLLVNLISKISLHTVAAGSAAGFFLFMSGASGIYPVIWFLAAVIISGLTAAARLRLNAHTPREIYSGWVLGLAGMGLCSFLC